VQVRVSIFETLTADALMILKDLLEKGKEKKKKSIFLLTSFFSLIT